MADETVTPVPRDLPDRNPQLLWGEDDMLDADHFLVEATARCRVPQAAVNWWRQSLGWYGYDRDDERIRDKVPSVAHDGAVEWNSPLSSIVLEGDETPEEALERHERDVDLAEEISYYPCEPSAPLALPFFKVAML